MRIDEVACFSHIGKRIVQEDNFFCNGVFLTPDIQKEMPEHQLVGYTFPNNLETVQYFAVSDGMGGHQSGEMASRMCVEGLAAMKDFICAKDNIEDVTALLQTAIAEINTQICNASSKYKHLKGMGATLVLCAVCEDDFVVLNIGDSRAYYFDGKQLMQITKDHTEGQRLLDLGLLTHREMLDFPDSGSLNRYMGYQSNGLLFKADEYYPKIDKGLIMLCSDGISNALSSAEIIDILTSADVSTACGMLVNEAASVKNADNCTAILIQVKEVMSCRR